MRHSLLQPIEVETHAEGWELALTLGVIEQALNDLRPRRVEDRSCEHFKQRQADAKDFLLTRLWELGNIWGDVLRCHGITKPLTLAQLCHWARRLKP